MTAPKGRRGCLSYIDFGTAEDDDVDDDDEDKATAIVATAAAHNLSSAAPAAAAVVHVAPQAYIPSAPQYIQSTYTITPLSQMQVLHGGEYGEIVAVLGGGGNN